MSDPKIELQRVFAVICSEHGVIGYNLSREAMEGSDLLSEHKRFHAKADVHGVAVLEKMRQAAASRKKMESTTMCQCPCGDHTGCIPNDRDVVYEFDVERIEGMPKALVICTVCKEYWDWRMSQMDAAKVEAGD